MTVEQMKEVLGAERVRIYPAKDKETKERKYNAEGEPIYNFLAYDKAGKKIANGYTSHALGKLVEAGEYPRNVECVLVEDGPEPYFMMQISNALAEF